MLRRLTDDAGSAVTEFSLVSIVLVMLFLAIVQLGAALFVRNTLVACAAEGARYGANADRDDADAVVKARELITLSLPDAYARDISAGYDTVAGWPAIYVEVRADLPLLGWFTDDLLVVRAHALEESR